MKNFRVNINIQYFGPNAGPYQIHDLVISANNQAEAINHAFSRISLKESDHCHIEVNCGENKQPFIVAVQIH